MMWNISESITADFCQILFTNYSSITNGSSHPCCGYFNDTITYWPPTPANSHAIQRCPARVGNSVYNVKENASRFCDHNGIWENTSDYNKCIFKHRTNEVLVIWFVGYTISMISLWIALILLRYFRVLRCLRNEIHCNLIVSYILRVLMWYFNLLPQMMTTHWSVVCANIATALHLFTQTTNYFWMFVEGLYLFTVIVWTYGIEKFTTWHYSIIGWGIPFILAATAILAIIFTSDHNTTWLEQSKTVEKIKLIVIHIPITISIIINVLVMAFIIFTLIKKVKQTKQPIRRHSSKFSIFSIEYKKAIKATVVLIPLLGIAHFLVLFKTSWMRSLPTYKILSSLLISTQGFFVALIYCFLNREVRFVLNAKYNSFRGFLPNNSRIRQTIDDNTFVVRRNNSILKAGNSNESNQVFQCKSLRIMKSNSESTLENVSVAKDDFRNPVLKDI